MKLQKDGFNKSAVIMLILTFAVWLIFAPIQFGGQAAYVIVSGNSMEPVFHRDDLIILYRASDYQVGDIATYRHPNIGPIIHRIIAKKNNQFVFQGDNNSWVDTYTPSQDEIIGKVWLHLPVAGKFLKKIQVPWLLALIAAATTTIFMTTPISLQKGQKTYGQPKKPPHKKVKSMENNTVRKTDVLFFMAALALGSFILAAYVFKQPGTTTKQQDINYQHVGVFSYSASAPPGIYKSDVVQAGEPIFRQLINQVVVNFEYHLDSDLPPNVGGTYQLELIVSHNNGWNWTINLQPETSFIGNSFNTAGVIDLAQIQTLIDNLEQQTGLQNQQYTLTIAPKITVKGALIGHQITDEFSPQLSFQLSPLQMQVVTNHKQTDPFTHSQSGQIKQSIESPNTLSLMNFQFDIATVRIITMISFILFTGGTMITGLLLLNDTQRDAASKLQSKYGSFLISIRNSDLTGNSQMVEVNSIDDLAKIAERSGQMILYQIRGSTHHYYVQDNNTAYHFQLAQSEANLGQPVPKMRVRPL